VDAIWFYLPTSYHEHVELIVNRGEVSDGVVMWVNIIVYTVHVLTSTDSYSCHNAHGTIHILVSSPIPFQNNAWDFGKGVHTVGWPVFQTKIKYLPAVQKRFWQVSVFQK
jgi:hypothetical protein